MLQSPTSRIQPCETYFFWIVIQSTGNCGIPGSEDNSSTRISGLPSKARKVLTLIVDIHLTDSPTGEVDARSLTRTSWRSNSNCCFTFSRNLKALHTCGRTLSDPVMLTLATPGEILYDYWYRLPKWQRSAPAIVTAVSRYIYEGPKCYSKTCMKVSYTTYRNPIMSSPSSKCELHGLHAHWDPSTESSRVVRSKHQVPEWWSRCFPHQHYLNVW